MIHINTSLVCLSTLGSTRALDGTLNAHAAVAVKMEAHVLMEPVVVLMAMLEIGTVNN